VSDVPVPTRSPQRRPDLPSLTSLRAFAALAVLLYHLNRWSVTDVLPFGVGYAGVTFFFVLSGFILTWSHVPEQRAGDFWFRRFARVYPNHLLLWLLVVLVPIAADPVRLEPALANLLLVQAWDPGSVFQLNGVAWSLSCEVFFYALFPLLLVAMQRLGTRRAALITAVCSVAVGAGTVLAVAVHADDALLTTLFTDPLLRLPEFLIGMVAARFLIDGGTVRARWLLPALLVAVAGLAVVRERPAADVWLTPLVVVLITVLARADLSGARSVLHSRPLLLAGRVSFAFYLTHELAIISAERLLGPGWSTALIATAVAAAAAALVHRFVEVPSNRWLIERRGRARSRSPRSPVGADPA
jgi:peptidoglycan/LPS O-acetylase OafA/YrhL